MCSVNDMNREFDQYKVVQFELMITSHYSHVQSQQGVLYFLIFIFVLFFCGVVL